MMLQYYLVLKGITIKTAAVGDIGHFYLNRSFPFLYSLAGYTPMFRQPFIITVYFFLILIKTQTKL